jgi:hypothetical protein
VTWPNGWLYRFLNRSGLTLRRVSTAGRELPTDAKDSIENFILECKGHIHTSMASYIVLIYDNAPCHLTTSITAALQSIAVKPILVPPRLTNLCQPADFSWMRPLKKAFHDRWQHWFLHGLKTTTRNNNVRSPGYAQVIHWISDI